MIYKKVFLFAILPYASALGTTLSETKHNNKSFIACWLPFFIQYLMVSAAAYYFAGT